MANEPAPPPSASASGIFSGCALTICLHLAVSLVVIVIGGAMAKEGAYVVFVFWIGLGFLQWLYLYPAIRFSRSRGWPGVVLGIWVTGGVTLAFYLVQMGVALLPVALEKMTGNSAPRVTYSGTDIRVVSTDATHIVARAGLLDEAHAKDEETETYVVDASTEFDFRGPAWREQSRPAGLDWLKPERKVSIDYVIRNRQRLATLVTIWVEQPEG